MFQKIRLDFWGVAVENFREQWNIREGTPGRHVLNGDFDLSRNVCLVNEIKIVFNFVFVCLVEGWVGRVLYFSGRRGIVNGLVAPCTFD